MNQTNASNPVEEIFAATLAGLDREFIHWATEELEENTCEDLAADFKPIGLAKQVQLGYTLSNLEEAHEELKARGECLDLPEHVGDMIATELSWNYDKKVYDQLEQAVLTGFAAKDVALWRAAYGWSKNAQKLLARADRLSDALHPRNATVDLNEAVRISSGGQDMGLSFTKLIEAARLKYDELHPVKGAGARQ